MLYIKSAKSLILGIIFSLASIVSAEKIELTNTKGKSITVELIQLDKDKVTVLRKRKKIEIPLANLDKASQEKLKPENWALAFKDGLPTLAPRSTDALKPGEERIVKFETLSKTLDSGSTAQMTIYVGNNVDPLKPAPVMLWLAQASGSSRDIRGRRFTLLGKEHQNFIVVALPYPKNYGERGDFTAALYKGQSKKLEEFHSPMLEKLKELVPNADPRLRIAGGFSNGGHTIANYLTSDFKPFTNYFNAFIIVDGGATGKERFTKMPDCSMIFLIGMDGYDLKKQLHYVPKAAKRAGMDVNYVKMEGVGHKFPEKYQAEVKKILAEEVIPRHLKREFKKSN